MRLGAALLVVFVHSGNLILAYQAETPMFLKPFLMLADAGDAIFMMISGYLLFLHPFQYGSMLKKKVRTILVPLVLWNLIWILIDLVRLDLRGTASGILTWPVSTWTINLFGIPFHTAPFYMPFWFLTDLFGLILLSPLIRFLTKKTPFLAGAGIVILWFMPISYRIRIPFCFFLFGALLAEYPQWKEKLKSIAADFCDYAKSAYGEITFSTDVADRFCFSVGKNAVEKALKEYLKERNSIIPESGHENALFLSMQNKRLSVRAVEKLVKKYASAVTSLKKITPHKLRSTYGTSLYRETGDIYLVADVLGHNDVNTTRKHYAALQEDRRRSARNKVRLREDPES